MRVVQVGHGQCRTVVVVCLSRSNEAVSVIFILVRRHDPIDSRGGRGMISDVRWRRGRGWSEQEEVEVS